MAVAKASTLEIIDEKGLLNEHQNDIGGFRAFCSDCGTRVFNYAPDTNVYFGIALSTVDTPIELVFPGKRTPEVNAMTEYCSANTPVSHRSGKPLGRWRSGKKKIERNLIHCQKISQWQANPGY